MGVFFCIFSIFYQIGFFVTFGPGAYFSSCIVAGLLILTTVTRRKNELPSAVKAFLSLHALPFFHIYIFILERRHASNATPVRRSVQGRNTSAVI